MTDPNFPPSETPGPGHHAYGDEGPCSAVFQYWNEVSAAPPAPWAGAGSSYIKVPMIATGPHASSIASGDCEEKTLCKFVVKAEINIEPTDPATDIKTHYEFWHGKGSWPKEGEIPENTGYPKWELDPEDDDDVTWGYPGNEPPPYPQGFSAPRLAIQLEIPCGGDSITKTYTAYPKESDESHKVEVTFAFTCNVC